MFPGRRHLERADNTGNPTLHKPFIDHTNQQFRFPPPNLHSPFLHHILHTCNFSLRELSSVSLHVSLSLSFQLYLNTESWKWIKYNLTSLLSLSFVEMQGIELCSIFINISLPYWNCLFIVLPYYCHSKVKWSQTPCYTARYKVSTKFYRKPKPKMKEGTQLTNPNEAHKWYMEMIVWVPWHM